MKEFICIICPRGCRLLADEKTLRISGNSCDKGITYAKSELLDPKRTLTGTVEIKNSIYPRLPVRTDKAIPKNMIADCMRIIKTVSVGAPVEMNAVIIKNIAGTGADIIASRSMEKINND